jgi:hypothetical protein
VSPIVNVLPVFVVSKPHDDVDRIPPLVTSPLRLVIRVVTSSFVSPSAPPTPTPSVALPAEVMRIFVFVQADVPPAKSDIFLAKRSVPAWIWIEPVAEFEPVKVQMPVPALIKVPQQNLWVKTGLA